jgi:dinuclear metal center YbgI/SA1388 family protein
MAKIGDVLRIVDRVMPESLAREWDNPGFQVGSLDWEAKGIIISLDADVPLFDRAKGLDANIAITHHPLIFDPIKRVDLETPVGKVLDRAIKDRVAVYSAHTNLDIMEGGVNDTLAKRVGLLGIRPFAEIGRIGELPSDETPKEIAERLKADFSISHVTLVGDLQRIIKRVAVCGGSGGSLVKDAVENGADLLITGDVKYHAAKDAEAYGISVMDIGHFASESVVLPVMASFIKEALEIEGVSLDVHVHVGKDPLKIY